MVGADARAGARRIAGALVQELRRHRPGGLLEKVLRRVVRAQQRSVFGGQRRIGEGGARQQPLAAGGVELERLIEQRADAAPVDRQLCSSRASQARASAQCRLTVAGEMSIASAVSSIESPPKKRSSTMRA